MNEVFRWWVTYGIRLVMMACLLIIAAHTCAHTKQLDAIREAVESRQAPSPERTEP